MMNKFLIAALIIGSFATAQAQQDDRVLLTADNAQDIFVQSGTEIRKLYRELGLGRIQIQSNQLVQELRKEIVTSTDTDSSSENAAGDLKIPFLSWFFSSNANESSRVDHARIITTNAVDLQRQEGRVAQDLVRLQNELLALLENQNEAFIRLKEWGVVHAAATYELIKAGKAFPKAISSDTLAMVEAVHLDGAQTVSRCIQTKYANTLSFEKANDSGQVGFRFLFLKFKFGESSSSESYHRRYAYKENVCSSTTNEVRVDQNESVYAVNLSALDQVLEVWISAANLASTVHTKAPIYPTWGSPFFR